jgi:hypothetical protein
MEANIRSSAIKFNDFVYLIMLKLNKDTIFAFLVDHPDPVWPLEKNRKSARAESSRNVSLFGQEN